MAFELELECLCLSVDIHLPCLTQRVSASALLSAHLLGSAIHKRSTRTCTSPSLPADALQSGTFHSHPTAARALLPAIPKPRVSLLDTAYCTSELRGHNRGHSSTQLPELGQTARLAPQAHAAPAIAPLSCCRSNATLLDARRPILQQQQPEPASAPASALLGQSLGLRQQPCKRGAQEHERLAPGHKSTILCTLNLPYGISPVAAKALPVWAGCHLDEGLCSFWAQWPYLSLLYVSPPAVTVLPSAQSCLHSLCDAPTLCQPRLLWGSHPRAGTRDVTCELQCFRRRSRSRTGPRRASSSAVHTPSAPQQALSALQHSLASRARRPAAAAEAARVQAASLKHTLGGSKIVQAAAASGSPADGGAPAQECCELSQHAGSHS